MMTFFKKRSNAIIIVAAVGLLFTLWGARRSLNREAAKVENLFYEGAEDGETPISTYLDNLFKEAKTVYSIAVNYLGDEATAGFRSAYNDLYNASTIGAKYDCYAKLMTELDTINLGLAAVDVVDQQTGYLNTHVANMRNISRMIESSHYNNRVADFERTTLGAFPANVLKLIVRPDTPEYFKDTREG